MAAPQVGPKAPVYSDHPAAGLPYTCASFYKFTALSDLPTLRSRLKALGRGGQVMGNVIVAPEGINCQVAGLPAGVDIFVDVVRQLPGLADVQPKLSYTATQPFYRMKVTIKEEIVKLGLSTRAGEVTGHYVDPPEWNTLLQDPEVLVIDTRNSDEIVVGTFRNAINPDTHTFTEFPKYVDGLAGMEDRKIAMFCTGGIRCEKASAYMLDRGFKHVYQLHGGVLKYFETVPSDQSLWDGELFVFDSRIAVCHGPSGVENGTTRRCFACRASLAPGDLQSPAYQEGVSCPYCHETQTPEQRRSHEMRQKQIELGRQRLAAVTPHAHIGDLARLCTPRPNASA